MSKITYSPRKIGKREMMYPVMKGRKLIEDHLIGALPDAEKEIAKAFQIYGAGLGYAIGGLERVDNAGTEEAEYTPFQETLMSTLTELKRTVPLKDYGITVEICAFCDSVEAIAERRDMRHGQVINILVNTLNEWAILRGWGDQKK